MKARQVFKGPARRGLVGWMTFGTLLLSSAARADMIYYSDTGQLSANRSVNHIVRVNTDGTGAQTILTATGTAFGGIAFDQSAGYLYSGDTSSLFRTNLDGSNRVNLTSSRGNTGDVELDLAGGKIYWTVAGAVPTEVFRANLDGSGVELILSRNTTNFEGLAIDHTSGKLFYAVGDIIGVSNLDGTGQTVLKTLPTGSSPHDVEIDTAAMKLYWNQDSPGNVANRLLRSTNLDGTGTITDILAAGASNRFPNGINFDSVNQALYYTSSSNTAGPFGMFRVNPDGTGNRLIVNDGNGINYMEVLHTSAVPEPGPLALMCLGAITVFGYTRVRARSDRNQGVKYRF